MNEWTRWRQIGRSGQHGRLLSMGEGPDLVLLASPLASGECYLQTARHLAAYGRTHLLEMPGSGRSARLTSPWSAPQYAAWVAEALADLGPGAPTVIGHSYSGMVAVELAVRFPERVGALVLADAAGAGAPSSPWQGFVGALIDIVLDLRIVVALWPYVARDLFVHSRNFFAMLLESLQADLTSRAAQVSVPSLVAWGGGDHTLPPWAAQVYAASLPQAWVHIAPGVPHTWVVGRPAEFARAVGEFLARTAGTSRMPAAIAPAR